MIFPDQSKNKIVTFTMAPNFPYSRTCLPIYYLKLKITKLANSYRLSSSSSSHQTILFHSSVHCFPTSLNIIKSSTEQGCASWEHCNMCAVVSSAFPHAHVCFHFFLCAVLQVYPVHRRLRHLHVVHGL